MNIRLTIITLLAVFTALCAIPTTRAVSPAPDGGYGGNNTAEGTSALFSLTTGIDNTALGFKALYHNANGNYNSAEGFGALFSNVGGSYNTATGCLALWSNSSGTYNTATGYQALYSNNGGQFNTATGEAALYHNTSGGYNTATGLGALLNNKTGSYNTATGMYSLYNNTGGSDNTCAGYNALHSNTGNDNTAIGYRALEKNTTGHDNTAIGVTAGNFQTSGSDNVYIGAGMVGVAGESNACYIASIFNQLSFGGTAVFVNSSGKLGTFTAVSSARFKDEIKPMDKSSEAILALKPVEFHYKKKLDPAGVPQFGLIAEEVEKINPDLITRDRDGKPYTVRYDAVNAMLLNEFLKEHRKVEAQQSKIDNQQATITELKSTLAQQQQRFESRLAEQDKQIEVLRLGLQKVSAQLEPRKPAPQVAFNNQ